MHRSRLITGEFARKRTLVTGGAGVLGSHLCERLLDAEHKVLCVDNFFTGTEEYIRHLVGRHGFDFLRHDVTQPLYVEVDEIYNLACPASPIHYQHDPIQTTKVSVLGALNMLGLAKRLGVPMLHASTSEVYGNPDVHPQPEGYGVASTRSVRVRATTRASAAPRACSSIATDATG